MSEASYIYHLILPHATEPMIYLEPRPEGWALPYVMPEERHLSAVSDILTTVEKQLGLQVTVLRCVSHRYQPENDCVTAVYWLENHSLNKLPEGKGSWVSCEDIANLQMVDPFQKAYIAVWFKNLGQDDQTSTTAPWMGMGWYQGACRWIRDEIDSQGYQLRGPIRQVRSQALSTVLRVPINEGNLYFKGVSPFFNYEGPLTQYLGQRFAKQVPQVIALDEDKGYMLLSDFGSSSLTNIDDVKVWQKAVSEYATMQINLIGEEVSLMALGCPDRRLPVLEGHVDILSDNLIKLASKKSYSITPVEQEKWVTLQQRLKDACWQLGSYGIPHTLDHGDFYAGNIHVNKEDITFFDWSNGCITHPFFSLLPFFLETNAHPITLTHSQHLLGAYLEPWTIYATTRELHHIFTLAQRVAEVHAAYSCYNIVANASPHNKWEVEHRFPSCIRAVLRAF